MVKRIIIYVISISLINSCNAQQSDSVKKASENLVINKSRLPQIITKHFPDEVISFDHKISLFTDTSESNIGLMLYQYNMEKIVFDSICDRILALNFVAKYNHLDTCLLIVNRNQTDPFEEEIKLSDNLAIINIDDKCYASKYPIPNFIGNDLLEKVIESFRINADFQVVVLEAKPNYDLENLSLKKNKHMPENWSNGYSNGVCYNVKSRTLIYWGLIW